MSSKRETEKPDAFAAAGRAEMPADVAARFARGANGHTFAEEQIIIIPRDEIEPDKDNPRRPDDPSMSEASLDALRTSIDSAGQKVPAIVGPRNESGKYRLIAGHRRFAAIMRSDVTLTLKAIFRESIPDGERGVLEIQLLENAHRPDVSPVSDAEALARFVALHEDDRAKVQAILGIDRATLGYKLQLAEAPAAIKDFARRANVRDLQALYELIKLHADDPEQAAAVIRDRLEKGDAQGMRTELKKMRADVKSRKEGDSGETGKGGVMVTGTRGRAPQATKAVIDWSKQTPHLYIESKGSLHRFALGEAQLQSLRDTLQRESEGEKE